jgi:CheY-like chemotaxis protein
MAHILIIDDDPAVLSLFGQFMESSGYSVALAADGQEGMRMMKQQTPDLIITDIMMPEMDGLEIIRAITKTHPRLPMIAISGGMRNVPVNFLIHAKQFGAHSILEKPVTLADLLQAVQELLRESAQKI